MNLEKFSKAYYNGTPLISDDHYDALVDLYGEEATIGTLGELPHLFKMYSQQKIFDNESIPTACVGEKLTQSPKLDGSAISLKYVDGFLVQGLTRGNGLLGTDISDKVMLMDSISKSINMSGLTQISGEVVTCKEAKNARNTAAGAFGLKDLNEFKKRNLNFIAYSIINSKHTQKYYTDDMSYLVSQGFNTVFSIKPDTFETDGKVYRINNNSKYYALGDTAKHMKGSYAHKKRSDEACDETDLLDIIFQTGASGKVTPVAIFKEVMLGDAKVSRATLNNVGYIEKLDLDIGDTILVSRAGQVIPKINANITKDIYLI